MSPRSADRLIDGLEAHLRFLKEAGVEDVFKIPPPPAKPVPPPRPGTGAEPALAALREEILACRKCGLAEGRKQAVPGEGLSSTPLMFVGEGPGRDEDLQGRPFVGKAGQLLTKIIAAMTFERKDVYIANIVKCRPPDNRVPLRAEVEACTPYLLRQIALIKPRVIVTLGKTATEFFLPDQTGSMTSIRGKFYDWNGLRIMPTFHPSYLDRNPADKVIRKMVWDDMQQVMSFLGRK